MTPNMARGRPSLTGPVPSNDLPHLDHTIVRAIDPAVLARFLADLLGMNVGQPTGLFVPVRTGNGVTLDFMAADASVTTGQHLAFAVSEQQFDEIFGRLVAQGVVYYADPHGRQDGRINHAHGGRGLYFHSPDGVNIEVQTIADGTQAS